jgi:quercetin dioxygenase-like cupin family protein
MPLVKTDATPLLYPEPGMVRQVLAHTDHIMLVRHTFDKGWVGAAHSHPHHQLVYVVSGSIKVVMQGEEFIANTGDSFVVDGNIEHQASALESSIVLDVFTPTREDYKP